MIRATYWANTSLDYCSYYTRCMVEKWWSCHFLISRYTMSNIGLFPISFLQQSRKMSSFLPLQGYKAMLLFSQALSWIRNSFWSFSCCGGQTGDQGRHQDVISRGYVGDFRVQSLCRGCISTYSFKFYNYGIRKSLFSKFMFRALLADCLGIRDLQNTFFLGPHSPQPATLGPTRRGAAQW